MLPCYIFVIFTLVLSVGLVKSYRILGLFPHPAKSHYNVFQPIMRELATLGHNVTVVSYFPDTNPPKENYRDVILTGLPDTTNSVSLDIFSYRPWFIHFLEFFYISDFGCQACDHALSSIEIREILQMDEKFDLIVMEQFNSDCMSGVAYKLQAPFVGISSSALMPWHYTRIGNPLIPSHIPALFLGYTDDMSYSQRLANWMVVHLFRILYRIIFQRRANAILRKHFGDDTPDVDDLVQRTSLILVNQHYSLSGAKPLSPAVIEIGGVHIVNPQQIDEELQQFLDNAEQGVIYISWGSMIRTETLPSIKRTAIVEALALFPHRVLWKWNNATLFNKPENVLIRKWMPQREILCHPNVKVFMTHGGLLGSSEAAYCGTPVVTTPMFFDQYLNAAVLAQRGMGFTLQYEEITKANVYKALKEALHPNTMENAKKVSYEYRNRPKSPLDTAIWWLEHVIATDGAPLTKSHSTVLPWYIYYSLDVYATFVCILIISILSRIWILRKLFFNKKPKFIKKFKKP